MASEAISGIGTKFRWMDGSIWAELAEITNIGGPNKTRDTIDVTNLDSPGGYKEYIAGMRDAGEISLDMNFTRETYAIVNALFESEDLADFQIMLQDDEHTTFSFAGLVTTISMGIPANDKISANATIKISGQITENSGSSA